MIEREIANNLFFTSVRNLIDSGNPVELKIKGTSMHPTLQDGLHKVVLVPYCKQSLQVGTIALFLYRGKHILHRLISISDNGLTFQGDNLPHVKELVREEDIIAVVKFIITPSGKVVDCKKQSFLLKSRWRRFMYQYSRTFIRRIKRFQNLSFQNLKI